MVVGIWTWTCIIWMAHQCLLSLADIPEVQKFSFQEDIEVGQRISVVCSVKLDTGLVSFRWLKNGKELEMLKNVRIKNDQEFSVLIIDPSSLEDEGNYTCVASNNFGSGKYTAHLSVKAPPTWIFKPVDIITTIGESTTINCIASGSPTPRIVWRKYSDTNPTEFSASFLDSETYHKSNNSILSISSVSYTDAGFYECVANNGIAPNIKANFSITIRDVPRIESFMFRDNIVEGSVVSVTCFALAKTKPISFEWLKNGMKITGMESNIRISTSDEISGLILEPVNLEDSGNYTCSATNINGKDKFTAELTVKASPKWLIQPNDEISTIGGSVTAQCVATGSPVPQIKWLKKIGEKDSDLKPVPHSLETKNSSILKINPISYDDAGLYICVADNGIEPSIKSNFTLVIRDILEVEKFSFKEDIVVGKRVSATCLVSQQTSTVSFKWLKNEKEVEISNNVRIKDDQEFSVLIIDPANLNDEGNYTCVASNSYGSARHTAHLSIKAPPKWQVHPFDIITTIGNAVTATCLASGSPTPNYTWRKFSEQNLDATRNLVELGMTRENGSILQIPSVSYEDSGLYECIADNGIQPRLKSNFSITIRDVPKIKKFHFDENIKEGDVTSVTCFAVSQNKPIKFDWKKNGKEIMEDNIRVKEDNEFTVLIFDYVKVNDGGNYTCSVSNPDGSDSYSAYLDVKAPPKWEILPIDILTTSGESIIIKCQAFGSPKPQISFRKVTGTMQTNTVPEISKFDTLNGLMNGTWKLSSVSSEDAGHYECVADNGIFPAIKSNFTILIRGIYIYFSGIWLCLIMIKYSNFSVHFQTNINRMRRGNHSLIFRLT